MCGIHLRAWKDANCTKCQEAFGVDQSNSDAEPHKTDFRNINLHRRGPDAQNRVSILKHPEYHQIECFASVLQMRAELTEQPMPFSPGWIEHRVDEQEETPKAYLCWNGEIYQHMPPQDSPEDGFDSIETFAHDISDTNVIAQYLETPMSESIDEEVITVDQVEQSSAEENIESSFYISKINRQLKHIAQVMARMYNAEFAFGILTDDGFFYGRDQWGRRSLLRWDCPEGCGSFQITSVAEPSKPSSLLTSDFSWAEVSPGVVHCTLFSSSTDRIPRVPYPKLSFSLPQPVGDIAKISPIQGSDESEISDRLWKASLELEFHLRKAVSMRLDRSSNRNSTGVLFSGGVDSVVLAALAADILASKHREERIARETSKGYDESEAESKKDQLKVPILYLYNVSFGPNPEKSADRKAALKSYDCLLALHQNKGSITSDSNETDNNIDVRIIFLDIVVEWEDILRKESHIRTLLAPKHTVMDINIATALWFASRGEKCGRCRMEEENEKRKMDDRSPRVLLLGMGADELMGGYGRHRKAFEKGGQDELRKELTMDQNRLWERNCGRDDRLCSDHGREARFPFLDANVVRFLKETIENEDALVCDFTLPPGIGDKRILRIVAKRLGLEYASGLVKRAIQFGSRISHLSDTKRFGSRRKAKGVAKI